MKKVIFLVMLSAALILISVFAWKNFRGIWPAMRKPPQDIAGLIKQDPAGSMAHRPPLKLAPGFSVSIFAQGLGKPECLRSDRNGTLLVSIPSAGKVVALPDGNGDGMADRSVTVAEGLNGPHGLAFRCLPECKLYVAQEDRVEVFAYDGAAMKATREKKLLDLPKGGFHVTRTLLFLPKPGQDRLLVSVGSSCNACQEKDQRRAAILSVPAEGGNASVYARGLRNAVFLATNARTGAVWATEMGRDMLGDDLPPDEINIIEQGGTTAGPIATAGTCMTTISIRKKAFLQGAPAPLPISTSRPIPLRWGWPFFPKQGGLLSSRTICSSPITGHGTGARLPDTRSSGSSGRKRKVSGQGKPGDRLACWLRTGRRAAGGYPDQTGQDRVHIRRQGRSDLPDDVSGSVRIQKAKEKTFDTDKGR